MCSVLLFLIVLILGTVRDDGDNSEDDGDNTGNNNDNDHVADYNCDENNNDNGKTITTYNKLL